MTIHPHPDNEPSLFCVAALPLPNRSTKQQVNTNKQRQRTRQRNGNARPVLRCRGHQRQRRFSGAALPSNDQQTCSSTALNRVQKPRQRRFPHRGAQYSRPPRHAITDRSQPEPSSQAPPHDTTSIGAVPSGPPAGSRAPTLWRDHLCRARCPHPAHHPSRPEILALPRFQRAVLGKPKQHNGCNAELSVDVNTGNQSRDRDEVLADA